MSNRFVFFVVQLRGAITSLHSKALAASILRALQQQLGAVIVGYELYPLKKERGAAFQRWHLELFIHDRETTELEIKTALSNLKGCEIESVLLVGSGALRPSKGQPEHERTPLENKRLHHRFTQAKSRARSTFKGK